MNQKLLALCGMVSPVLFVFTIILGGALRPGYSHISHTVSELFSPGSPNKRLLDALHTTCAVLTTVFGLGVLQFVRQSPHGDRIGLVGAGLIIATGLVNVATATVFPQDAWGAPPTSAGQMHKILAGVLAFLSILSTLLMGIWVNRAGLFPGFGTYSFVTVAVLVLSGGFAVTKMGTPIMGLTERITIFAGLPWTFLVAWNIFMH